MKENWLYGAAGWLAFALSIGLTIVCFSPVYFLLSILGVDLTGWTRPLDQIWAAISLSSVDGKWVIFSLVFFPFIFRNFLRLMATFPKDLKPKNWPDAE
jgi:ABC-type Fe3+ transport system permease subunit